MAMILYNMRYRGPYEYDKFVLNIYQLHNEVQRMLSDIKNSSFGQLQEHNKNLQQIIDYYASDNSIINQLMEYKEERV